MRTRLLTCGLVAFVAATASIAVACGGGGGDGGSSNNGGQPAGGQASQGPTGLPEVDHLIQAARDGNFIELASLAGYQKVGCEGGGTASAPPCRSGEASGTKVEALAFSNCDHSWIRPEQVSDQYKLLLSSGQVSLYAAYHPNDTSDTFEGGFGSTVVVVLSAGQSGVALHVKDGRVTWIEKECKGIGDLVAGSRVKSMIVAPGGSAETPGATP
ncbi:MAG: hypothetical protein EPO22_08395 [Dehalococcoidia bacterium]|nr:MAG: hypothetical protein EPO22_08395 [Dehalococcoidia bacterium]